MVTPAVATGQSATTQGASITSESFGFVNSADPAHPEQDNEVLKYTLTNRKGMRVSMGLDRQRKWQPVGLCFSVSA